LVNNLASGYEKGATAAKMFNSVARTIDVAGPLEKGSVEAQ
jgi:hypothetical protein